MNRELRKSYFTSKSEDVENESKRRLILDKDSNQLQEIALKLGLCSKFRKDLKDKEIIISELYPVEKRFQTFWDEVSGCAYFLMTKIRKEYVFLPEELFSKLINSDPPYKDVEIINLILAEVKRALYDTGYHL